MMRVSAVLSSGLAMLAMTACSGSSGGGGGDDTQMMIDAPPAQQGTWTTLLSKNWSLQPLEEKENELAIDTLDREFVVGGIRPIAPPGTHHTLLFRGLTGTNAIYASGVGTGELIFPPGKGLRLTSGTTLGLQLHIYNTGDEVMTGLSGVEVLEVDSASVTEEIDLFLPGPKDGDLQIGPGVTTHSGTCTLTSTQSVFALFPHMHKWGTHLKTTLKIGGVDQVLHDGAYDFEHQDVITFAPIQMASGDSIKTECTYNNDTGALIQYGESSDTEMCYSIMYRYPKQTQEFCND
jgi:Copper type II ascorbate-dependent monooxygenase, C-terminal domain